MPLTIINGPTIAVGQSLSDVLDISAQNTGLTKILFPEEWTTDPTLMLHSISFQWSPDGLAFYNLCDIHGNELLVKVTPGGLAVLDRDIWRSGFMKFRAGPSRQAVPQEKARTFKCIVE